MKYVKCGGEIFEFKLTPFNRVCQYCKKNQAVIKPVSTPLLLCKECFLNFCEKKVKIAIKKHKMFNQNDKLGVAVSGGKDSAALLTILKKLYPKQEIVAIHLNLSIKYYSEFAEKAVKELCKKLDVPLIIYNLKEKENFSIDDFVFTNFKNKICSVCGTIKRYYFAKIARENGINVICTAHHLDDVLSTMTAVFFQGDFLGLSRLEPKIEPLYKGQARKIKPLYYLQENDIFYYTALSKLPLESCACPHQIQEISPVKKWKDWIEKEEKESPSFKYRLFSIFRKKLIPLLKTSLKEEKKEFFPCEICQEMTHSVSKICTKCRRVKLLERIKDKKLEYEPEEFIDLISKIPLSDIVIFDVREKNDFEKGSFPNAIWLDSALINKDNKTFLKTFKPYKKKKLFFLCYTGRTSYYFVLRLRKLNFLAFNLSNPKKLLSLQILQGRTL
jgi:tRNA(Ile)-lysidine synthase TilS/MesJ